MFSWATDTVWDFTFERHPSCGVPMDFHAPVQSDLNLTFWGSELADYPDQRLLGFLLEGTRMEADVEHQSVWVPHLESLPRGYQSVSKELTELEGRGWYRSFTHLPFWPLYLNAQGSVARKLEPDRCRRTTDGGGPRQPTYDEEGLRALSVNEASKAYHLPRHHQRSINPEIADWLAHKHLLPGQHQPDLQRGSKWPPELKPNLDTVMQYVLVLRRAAHLLGEPIYILSDDFKNHFNQLALAPEEYNLFNVAFLSEKDAPDLGSASYGRLKIVSERRLGFGCHPSSKVAQRFSDAVLHLFRKRMDELDRELEPLDQRPTMLQWRDQRAKVAAKQGTSTEHESRLWGAVIYTDDPIICVVGVERAIRAIRTWRAITREGGILMAVPEKRVLGAWAKWLGTIILGGLGLVVITRDKLLRAKAAIRQALSGTMMFCDYRSLMGLLEHLRSINREKRNVMYGLYEPHLCFARGDIEVASPIDVTPLMHEQLGRWLRLSTDSGGAPVTAIIHPLQQAKAERASTFVLSADAATDCEHPGLGGFCHGLWWYYPIDATMLRTLHITALELLATGINAITFAPYIAGCRRAVLLSDALATPFTLTRHNAKSPALAGIHRDLLALPEFASVAELAECCHFAGVSNVAADAVSRWKMSELMQLCSQLGIKPQRISTPPSAHTLVQRAVARAQERRAPDLAPPRRPLPPTIPLPVQLVEEEARTNNRRSVEGAPTTRTPESNATEASVNLRNSFFITGGYPGTTCVPIELALRPLADLQEHIRKRRGAPSHRQFFTIGGKPLDPSAPNLAAQGVAPGTTIVLTLRAPGGGAVRRLPSLGGGGSQPPAHPPIVSRTISRITPQNLRGHIARSLRVETRMIANLHLAAVGNTAHAGSARKRRATLERSSSIVQAAGSQAWDTSQLLTPQAAARLKRVTAHAIHVGTVGSAEGTLRKDELAWERWSTFGRKLGFDPHLRADATLKEPDVVSAMLAGFPLYVYPTMKGKRGQVWAKPRSAFDQVLSIIRIYKRWNVPMPKPKVVECTLKGLLRGYEGRYGKLVLAPTRKLPMLHSMMVSLHRIPPKTKLGPYIFSEDDELTQDEATVDALQMGSVPIVDESEGYAALHQLYCCPDDIRQTLDRLSTAENHRPPPRAEHATQHSPSAGETPWRTPHRSLWLMPQVAKC
jgi:hypothetical protein